MRLTSSTTTLSPTDLSAFAECSHRTLLDFAAARKLLKRPGRNEIELELLEKRGREHEARVLAHFQGQGLEVHTASLHLTDPERGARETAEAMGRGFDVIYQGTLLQDGWVGRPDFLLKVDDGHYEPADAKLARSAKAAAILQLCAYVEALGATQGRAPEHFHLALGTEPLDLPRLRAADFMAYYRRAKAQLGEFVREIGQREDLAASIEVAGGQLQERATSSEGKDARNGLPYPEPVSHCGVCDWWKRCEDRRRADDHLSLVASITRKQRDRLADQCTTRVTELAALSPSARVPGIEPEPLTRIREQARIQVEGREEKRTKHELLADFDPGSGLEALPKPSPGDLFFDLEGDAFYESTGLEYLFGLVELGQISRSFTERTAAGPPKYLSHWATSRVEEKAAFEAVIDRIQAGRAELADMHVYHFGHREADAVRRLSCFHKTREDAVDDMLRNHVFVDLHRIVRQSLRASVESYSLQLLEPLYGFTRKT
ncbi:MAG TPA: TM0106 family RecB-like putative nuclease, partial [Polyangiaceae bacterium]|nr:TM0106 family RecB-like putative nuclease [Polyangiaceae bacterium]